MPFDEVAKYYARDTVMLVGSGAVENAWAPVLRALNKHDGSVGSSADVANLGFSLMIHQIRWFQQQMADSSLSHDWRQESARGLKRSAELCEAVKVTIATELQAATASDEIRLRPELKLIERLYFHGRVGILTTNWDTCVGGFAEGRHDVVHLHGDCTDPQSLYLPSETIEDVYKPPHVRDLHGRQAGAAMFMLESAKTLIVYGLSLSALDVELGILLMEGIKKIGDPNPSQNPEHVVIVDPQPKVVEARLRFFIRRPQTKFTVLTPEELRAQAVQ